MSHPKAEIVIAQTVTPVVFNLATLKRIEDATGKTLQQIADEFQLISPKEFEADGKTPTDEAIQAAARRFSVGFAASFVAGAADVPIESIPLKDAVPAFNALCPAFIDAWKQMMGGEDADPKLQAGGSGESPPGPASTSASNLASSSGLAQGNSET